MSALDGLARDVWLAGMRERGMEWDADAEEWVEIQDHPATRRRDFLLGLIYGREAALTLRR